MKKYMLAIALGASVALTACVSDYSTGSRVGHVTKLSHKGIIFKSYEAEMNLGGFKEQTDSEGRSSVIANTFQFNVPADQVQNIRKAMEANARVEVFYSQWLISPPNIDNDHVAKRIEFR